MLRNIVCSFFREIVVIENKRILRSVLVMVRAILNQLNFIQNSGAFRFSHWFKLKLTRSCLHDRS